MTANFVLRQRCSVHMITDGAVYDGVTGELHAVDFVKCVDFPDQQMAIACTGSALLSR
jgi:hypothetical protein